MPVLAFKQKRRRTAILRRGEVEDQTTGTSAPGSAATLPQASLPMSTQQLQGPPTPPMLRRAERVSMVSAGSPDA
jgi:hypothetical protein